VWSRLPAHNAAKATTLGPHLLQMKYEIRPQAGTRFESGTSNALGVAWFLFIFSLSLAETEAGTVRDEVTVKGVRGCTRDECAGS
jgi:hypothetical protein